MPNVTNAAEGLPRRRFTVAELERMVAAFGIADLWVIDAVRLRTFIHRQPSAAGTASICEYAAGDRLEPLASPALAVTLSDLDLR